MLKKQVNERERKKMKKNMSVPYEKNVENRIELAVAHGDYTHISFDGFQGSDISFLNKKKPQRSSSSKRIWQ